MVLDEDETTGNFKTWTSLEISAVVIDLGSEVGFIGISSTDGRPFQKIVTGPSKTGYLCVQMLDGQTCMLYGNSTVLLVRRQLP